MEEQSLLQSFFYIELNKEFIKLFRQYSPIRDYLDDFQRGSSSRGEEQNSVWFVHNHF